MSDIKEDLVELDFNKEAYEKTNSSEGRRIKLVLDNGKVKYCRKLVNNRNSQTNAEYPYAVLINSGLKKGDQEVWRKYCISASGKVFSAAKNEEGIRYSEETGEAFMLLPVEEFKKYLDTL